MLRFNRCYSTKPAQRLICGLEIHTQLNTPNKLFSLTPTPSLSTPPNTLVSYFDASLPGTQPKLNPHAVLYALKASVAMGCDVNLESTFDRKHYFYGDQPLGYQITQHYSPIAKNGCISLGKEYMETQSKGKRKKSTPIKDKKIRILQVQLEQDTGKSMYSTTGTATEEGECFSRIDLNRANVPLIEMVTAPDFSSPDEVKLFIRKYQNLVRYLGICTGDLETGAMRIDVNVSVAGYARVELKNLSTTSAVVNAIKFEFERQCELIEQGGEVIQETRGWDGTKTVSLRQKEGAVDYRYMPDAELPELALSGSIVSEVQQALPILPDEMLDKLIGEYGLKMKDALILTYDLPVLNYYLSLVEKCQELDVPCKLATNWLLHELLGLFRSNNKEFQPDVITVTKLSELLSLISNDKISVASGKYLLAHIFNDESERGRALTDIIEEYDLAKVDVSEAEIEEICQEIIDGNGKTVKLLPKKPNGLKFLIGRAMSITQGKVEVQKLESKFKEMLNV